MARIITVSGGKGGVGKTNLSVNLALWLARSGNRVCLLDADLGLANVNIMLGLYPEYDLEDVLLEKKNLREILIENHHGVDIIPGSSGVERLANVQPAEIDRILELFAGLKDYDFLVCDTSAGISRSVVSFCLSATDVIVVVTTEPTSLTDAYALLKVLCLNGFRGKAQIVVNQCKNTAVASRTYNKLKDVVHKYLSAETIPLGIVVQDPRVPEAIHRQQPLFVMHPECNASRCISVIANRLLSGETSQTDFPDVPLASFWRRFLETARRPLTFPERDGQADTGRAAEPENSPGDALAAAAPAIPGNSAGPRPEEAAERSGAPAATTPDPDAPTTSISMPAAETDAVLKDSHLPTLPHILLNLLEACGNDDTSMSDIAGIVDKDPALCAKILRLVNSVYYSFSSEVKSFQQALSLLGTDTIRSIAISAAVYRVFNRVADTGAFNLRQFWWHSLMCAVLARSIAARVHAPAAESAFLSGLLHDIGKLVLLQNDPDRYLAFLEQTGQGTAVPAAERAHLGCDHCEAGVWLTRHWHLQPFLADAIRYHHEPLHRIVDSLPLVRIVYAANRLAKAAPADTNCAEALSDLLEVPASEIGALCQDARDQVTRLAESLDIPIEPPGKETAAADEAVESRLAVQVRDVSLLQSAMQNFLIARTQADIVRTTCDGLQVVFAVKNLRVFLCDEEQQALVCAGPEAGPHAAVGLRVPCASGKSMLITALEQSRAIDSFFHSRQQDLTIVDEQLIRQLGGSGMLCLPMVVAGRRTGVVIIGLERDQLDHYLDQIRLLTMFVNYAAMAFEADRVRVAQARRLLDERLAASTAIARKIAHEVNNPLSIIKNYLKLLELNLHEHEVPADEIPIIAQEIDRVGRIVEGLSDFARPQKEQSEPIDLNRLVSDLAALMQESLQRKGTHLQLHLDEALPAITTAQNSMKQVLLNLLKNAGEALTNGGTISVATRHVPDAGTCEVTVTDTGPGIPEEVRARLFEPYTSTKGAGHAGLGLSVVYSTVRELGGTISCSCEPGQGTTFTMHFPAGAAPGRTDRAS